MKHFDASLDPGGPHYSPDIFGPDGRLNRFCGGGGDGGAGAAAASSAAQSQKQHEDNMRQLRAQARSASEVSSPQFTPASAPAAASVDTVAAGLDSRRKAGRRFGYSKTADTNALGSLATLGASAP
jgi:hypothetical protein